MRVRGAVAAVVAVLAVSCGGERGPQPGEFVGSASCRSCHEKFYQLWAASHHGLAMQPYTAEFARRELAPQAEPVAIGLRRYRADISGERGWIVEEGPDGEKRFPIEYALGGKNIYYFLTPYGRGRLQTLPLAYDVRRKEWFDTAASGVRHFPDMEDEPLDWTHRAYTFNTSCYGCHVSQLNINYDLESDTYRTTWREPGINCETCHGPAGEHVVRCQESEAACREDPRLIRTKVFDVAQTNSLCAPCHAKMAPLTNEFRPGDRYFDHFDLVTLEHRDFYPDGRDLGENYTFTSWRMSACAKSGKLDCVDCHTSSGRYRFRGDRANQACAPCHADKVDDPEAHTHHPADSPGSECVACHMPKTTFARMVRSDHSMRPPMPAATIEFGSPNACNLCHTDRDARWADRIVRRWRKRDYQAATLRIGRLVKAAREGDWSRLEEMLAYIASPERDEIFAASLIRLLRSCPDDEKWAVLIRAIDDPSPLVRSAAADALVGSASPEAVRALIRAARDDFRLVRVRAAASLAGTPLRGASPEDRLAVERATEEYIASMRARPDSDAGHTNLGNYYMAVGDVKAAIESYETAARLNPESVATLVNLAIAYNLNGENPKAEKCLRQALEVEPGSAPANFNLGLLLGEMGRKDEARRALERALEADPNMAAAAYNLCVLESERSLTRAVRYCRQAAETQPDEPKYAYTLGFYLAQGGRFEEAVRVLEDLTTRRPDYRDGYALLMEIYRRLGNREAAAATARRARDHVR